MELQTLGICRLVDDGREIQLTPFEASFLLYVADNARSSVLRSDVCDLMWPDSDPGAARHSLKQLTYQIRAKAGSNIIRTEGQTVSVGVYRVDVLELTSASNTEPSIHTAERLLAGWFMAGFEPRSHRLAAWVHSWRVRIERLTVQVADNNVVRGTTADWTKALKILETVPSEYRTPSLYELRVRLHALLQSDHAVNVTYQEYEAAFSDIRPIPPLNSLIASVSDSLASPDASAVLRFVGRETESRRLRHAWSTASTGQHTAILLCGESGIGKSRLAEQFLRRVALDGGNPWYIKCLPSLRRIPWANIVEFARDLKHHRTPAVARAAQAVVATAYTSLDENHEKHGLSPTLTLLARLRDLFAAGIDSGGVALVIDDIQWADEAMSTLVPYIYNNIVEGPLALVLAARDDAGVELPSWVTSELPELQRLELGPLEENDIAALLQQLEQHTGRSISPALRESVITACGGRPLLLINSILTAPDEPNAGGVHLPANVETMLRGKLAALADDCRWVVSALAVRGQPLPLTDLLALAHLDGTAARKALEIAVSNGILQVNNGIVAFRHDLMREAAYRTTDAVKKTLLHQHIGQHIMDRGGDPGTAAEHFAAAGSADDACHLALIAANRSVGVHLYTDYEYYLKLAEAQPSARASEARKKLVYHLLSMGRHDEAEMLVSSATDSDVEYRLLETVLRLERRECTAPAAIDEAFADIERISILSDAESVAPAVGLLLDRLLDSGDVAESDQQLRRLGTLSQTQASPLALHILAATAVWNALHRGYEDARRELRGIESSALRQMSPIVRAHIAFSRATVAMIAGDLSVARTEFNDAMGLSEQNGDIRRLHACRVNFGVLCLEAGEFRGAAEMFELVTTSTTLRFKIRGITNLALLHYEAGSPELCLRYLSALERLNAEYASPAFAQTGAAVKGLLGVALDDKRLIHEAADSISSTDNVIGDIGYVAPFQAWCLEQQRSGAGAALLRQYAYEQESKNRLASWRLYAALGWLAEDQMTVPEHEKLASMLRQASVAGARLLADRGFSGWRRRPAY